MHYSNIMKQSFASVDNISLRYLDSDPHRVADISNKPSQTAQEDTIVFIHGLGSYSDRWLDIPDALSLQGYRTIAMDLPGFGGSDKRPDIDYSVPGLVELTAKFLTKLGLSAQNTVLVGHSLGGYIAASAAAKFNSAAKLVLIDSSGLLTAPTPLLTHYYAAAMQQDRKVIRQVFEQMVAQPIRVPDSLVEGFALRMSEQNAKHPFKVAYDSSTSTQLSAAEMQVLRQLGKLVFLVWGEKDNLIPQEYFERFRQALPEAETAMVFDAGHAPFAEKPAVMLWMIQSFLAGK